MINAIVTGLAVVWLVYKWVIQKQMNYVLIGLLLFISQLSRWPLFWDKNLLGGILGFLTAILMGVEFYKYKRIASVYIYIIIILLISALLVIEPLYNYLILKK